MGEKGSGEAGMSGTIMGNDITQGEWEKRRAFPESKTWERTGPRAHKLQREGRSEIKNKKG